MNREPIHAYDPKGDLFEGLFPILYSVEGWTKGYYMCLSQHIALLADVFSGGLKGKDVLDIGCGYGTTTFAVSRFFPSSITAIDGSFAMTEMMDFLFFSDEDIEDWLTKKGIQQLLGWRFGATAAYLKLFRQCFRQNSFWSESLSRASLRISNASLESFSSCISYDVAIANNVLHWPVNKLKKELEDRGERVETEYCISKVLTKVRSCLKVGGVLVFTEPRELTTLDTDPVWEKSFDRFGVNGNSVFVRLNLILNRILSEKYSIQRDTPRNLDMFKVSRMPELAAEAGFSLEKMVVIEDPILVRPIDFFPSTLPINLATVDLSMAEKIEVIREAERELIGSLTDEEKDLPMQAQGFYFVLRAK